MSAPSIAAQVRTLQQMTVVELREEWRRVFGEETKQRHRVYMWKRLAWKLQGDRLGELTDEERAKVEQYREEFRHTPPDQWFPGGKHAKARKKASRPVRDLRLPPPGSVLTRIYQGHEVAVTVREEGIEYRGHIHRTLSAAARAITGINWNGYLFFGLGAKGGRR